MVWQSVPEELTISKDEAFSRYKSVDVLQQLVHSYDTDKPIPRTEDGMVDCYIMKGALKNVMSTYAWENSHTDGGYVQGVAERYLRRQFPKVLEVVKATPKYSDRMSILREFRVKYYREIQDIVSVIGERYWMHGRTKDAVVDHVDPFGASEWNGE